MSVPVANDRYAELAELAGSFIHEIKNHLSTLGLNLQLLAEDFQEPQSQRERRALERIQRLEVECGQLVDVSNDFLRFARVQNLDLVSGSLTSVIEDLIAFFAPTAQQCRINVKCYLPVDLPNVELDQEWFKQALLNLFLNAQQAMPDGGELTIQAQRVIDCGLGVNDPCGKSAIELCLIDTGQGMSADVLAKVFRPFFSTKPGGSGLGLPTTRKIIEAHGGTLHVESEVGKGTRFTVRLPVPNALPEPSSMPVNPQTAMPGA